MASYGKVHVQMYVQGFCQCQYRHVHVYHAHGTGSMFTSLYFLFQEEYYATHQCFLSRRSLYLVVWNVMDGREGVEELKPWLLNIQVRRT